jgi:serine protease Do
MNCDRRISLPIRVLGYLALTVLALLPAVPAQAQKDKAISKGSPKVLAAFHDVVAKPSESTVRIRCDGKDVALGTIISADGWILTKASELKDNLVCKLKDGREFEARVVGVQDKFDLAMLKIEVSDLKPVEWAASKVAPVGNWVASPGLGETPVAIGVVSVGTRDVTGKGAAPAPSPTSGYLGVALDLEAAGVKISQILPGTGADKAGLKANDHVLSVNGEAVDSADAFMTLLQRHKPGDVVTLKVMRGDKESEFKATLGKRPSNTRGDFQNSLGSELSARRTGFPTILQHDSVIKPADCGGPLVDLDGHVIGINIARAGRTESYAVPTEAIQPLLGDLKSGKLAPKVVAKEATSKLSPEEAQKLAEAKAALQKAEAERAAIEKKVAEARAALERLQAEQEKKAK